MEMEMEMEMETEMVVISTKACLGVGDDGREGMERETEETGDSCHFRQGLPWRRRR